jgi:hypothetical protein
MTDASKISEARTTLYTALQGVAESPWRVHRVPPANPAPPCVWIGPYEQNLLGPSINISFPVVAVYDGADRRQVEALDDLGASVSDAIWKAKGRPTRSFASTIDVGGRSLRAVEYTAEFSVQGVTLCIPLLQEAV